MSSPEQNPVLYSAIVLALLSILLSVYRLVRSLRRSQKGSEYPGT